MEGKSFHGRYVAEALATIALTAVPPVVWGSTYAVTQRGCQPTGRSSRPPPGCCPRGCSCCCGCGVSRGAAGGAGRLVLGGLQPRPVLRPALPRRLPPAERARPRRSPRCRPSSSWAPPSSSSASGRRGSPCSRRSSGSRASSTLVWQGDRCRHRRRRRAWPPRSGPSPSSALGFALVKRWSPPDDVLVTTSWSWSPVVCCCCRSPPLAEGAPPALDGSARAGAALPRPGRLGPGLRAVVPRARPGWMPVPSPSSAWSTPWSARRSGCCCSPSPSGRSTWRRWRSPSAACSWRRRRAPASCRDILPAGRRRDGRPQALRVGPCPT